MASADELLEAAERRGAARAVEECCRLVCELCAVGDPPIEDLKAGRRAALTIARAELRAAEDRADARKAGHRRTCLICRAGSEETCRQLGAAAAVDLYLDHRRTCRAACRARRGGRASWCQEGQRLLEEMRRTACSISSRVRFRDADAAIASHLAHPDCYFHVFTSGETVRCAASEIRLRRPS